MLRVTLIVTVTVSVSVTRTVTVMLTLGYAEGNPRLCGKPDPYWCPNPYSCPDPYWCPNPYSCPDPDLDITLTLGLGTIVI